ncbi:MAG: glycogen/starch synthase [Bacteroidales bacterium]|nr:glycogen/starch synthase [Bacteroidales bacterium]
MGKGKILFVNQELAPYTEGSEGDLLCQKMASNIQNSGRDVRVFMPRFGIISDRRHQLHEVIRLSGMNLIVNNCDHQLIIKVGATINPRLQVYFIDNEEYFATQDGVVDNGKVLTPNIDERLLFYGRGVLEAVKKLSWRPHIIHYSGWFSAMVPFYLRRLNKENPFFKETRTVVNIYDNSFEGMIPNDINRKMRYDGATAKDLKTFQDLDYINLMKATITYAGGVVIASPNANPELVEFVKANKRTYVDYDPDGKAMTAKINKLYETLVGSGNLNNGE